LISESAWEEMTCLFAPSLTLTTLKLATQQTLNMPDNSREQVCLLHTNSKLLNLRIHYFAM
ncbi:hypothetical protein DJ483_00005, partial [Citrobacter freundii]